MKRAEVGVGGRAVEAAIFMALFLAVPVQGQTGIKMGLAASGYRATHSEPRVWLGEDYRPFLGYEVDLLQDDAYPRIALQLGIFRTLPVSEHMAVQPELHLALRGLRFNQMELYGEAYDLSTSHLQVPVLLRYDPTGWSFRPRLLLGPYVALTLSASRTLTVWGESDTKDLDNVKLFDYGLVFGVENGFTAWSQTLLVELRAEWGLASTMTQGEGFTDLFTEPGRINLVTLSLLLGYRF